MKWLEIAREIQALSQTGLAFSQTGYDTQRYSRLMEIASEIISEHTNLEKEATQKVLMQQPGYATPKIDVRAAVVKDDKILLVQEKADNRWAMPGGWADVGDMPSDVAVRETREESGFIVKAIKIAGVFDANRSGRPLELFHAFKLVFLCELLGGEATPSDETLDARFFNFDDLPELSSNRTNGKHLKIVLDHYKDRNLQPYFD